eukprot:SAG31_NODE_34937_length_327_cov_4.271930_1_plen_61_part_01
MSGLTGKSTGGSAPPRCGVAFAVNELTSKLVDDWRLAGSAMRKRMNERTRARASLTIKKVY